MNHTFDILFREGSDAVARMTIRHPPLMLTYDTSRFSNVVYLRTRLEKSLGSLDVIGKDWMLRNNH